MLSDKSLYEVEAYFDLSSSMVNCLTRLYQPLIGGDGLLLYNTLLFERKGSHKQLASILNIDLMAVERARIKLEELNLCQSYLDNQNYLYHLLPPLEFQRFLHHEVFGRLLISVMGKEYYQANIKERAEIDKSEMVNVTEKLDKSFLDAWTPAQEAIFNNKNEKRRTLLFNQDQLFAGISNLVFPYEHRTRYNIDLIMEMAELYEIPLRNIKELAFNSYDVATNTFDEEKFRSKVRRHPIKKKAEHSYDLPCKQFLEKFQNSGNLSDSNIRLLENVKSKFNLPNEVINVIVEHVLNSYNMDLKKSVVEHIAAQFDRLKIADHTQALKALQKSEEKQRVTKKTEATPQWIDRNTVSKSGKIDKEEYDEKEYQELMKRLSNNEDS